MNKFCLTKGPNTNTNIHFWTNTRVQIQIIVTFNEYCSKTVSYETALWRSNCISEMM